MTLGGRILILRGRLDDLELIAHELAHVMQWRELGRIRFLWRYLNSYLRGRLAGLGHWHAYERIPLEVEARARAGLLLRWLLPENPPDGSRNSSRYEGEKGPEDGDSSEASP